MIHQGVAEKTITITLVGDLDVDSSTLMKAIDGVAPELDIGLEDYERYLYGFHTTFKNRSKHIHAEVEVAQAKAKKEAEIKAAQEAREAAAAAKKEAAEKAAEEAAAKEAEAGSGEE